MTGNPPLGAPPGNTVPIQWELTFLISLLVIDTTQYLSISLFHLQVTQPVYG